MASVSFTRYLDDRKVLKFFGTRPWMGKRLPGKVKRVTVGVRWSLPKKDYVPDDNVLVQPCVVLSPLGKGKWRVTVEDQFREEADRYLSDNCM